MGRIDSVSSHSGKSGSRISAVLELPKLCAESHCGAVVWADAVPISDDARRMPELAPMPDKPTLVDFFNLRWSPANHVLQSATRALKTGMTEQVILACLLHDIGGSLMKADHGYWGAQLVEPYVDEEVTWAIRAHQVLRFYADESVGYEYPQSYVTLFGADYRPDPYLDEDYKRMRNHKWYMTSRMICVNDKHGAHKNSFFAVLAVFAV